MADNLVPGSSMATASMKPAAAGGENIDAIWGRNVGDFLAALRTRPEIFTGGYGTTGTSTTDVLDPFSSRLAHNLYILRIPGHNYLYGTYTSSGTFSPQDNPDCYGTHGYFFYGNLGTLTGTTATQTTNIGANFTFGTTFGFGIDLANYLSVGSWGTLQAYWSGTSDDALASRTITYTIGDSIRAYTTWV